MISERVRLGPDKLVVELGSNDGYLLQAFVERGIPALGIEPAETLRRSPSSEASRRWLAFFGADTARRRAAEGRRADLLVAHNVLAQVPDLNDLLPGMRRSLAPGGVATIEVPHLMRLLDGNQFDTIYHEHYSYFSLHTLQRTLSAHGLTIFDVEELPTHSGSVRVYAAHADGHGRPPDASVADLLARGDAAGLTTPTPYASFAARVHTKRRLLEVVISVKRERKTVAGYGASGKGNTLLS
jgi:hypothetical protein